LTRFERATSASSSTTASGAPQAIGWCLGSPRPSIPASVLRPIDATREAHDELCD
jgi:hypothetical protein